MTQPSDEPPENDPPSFRDLVSRDIECWVPLGVAILSAFTAAWMTNSQEAARLLQALLLRRFLPLAIDPAVALWILRALFGGAAVWLIYRVAERLRMLWLLAHRGVGVRAWYVGNQREQDMSGRTRAWLEQQVYQHRGLLHSAWTYRRPSGERAIVILDPLRPQVAVVRRAPPPSSGEAAWLLSSLDRLLAVLDDKRLLNPDGTDAGMASSTTEWIKTICRYIELVVGASPETRELAARHASGALSEKSLSDVRSALTRLRTEVVSSSSVRP